ncbi:LOW QUALITY PROTEIN: uncharacterized protein LOC106174703 [Lingula anatina]|uniref:LOW QUALITY PROTEIN: uncharacterized protein LOC106174703 n=1 Tax=Lingula anatina TaxID=7574 RepID=A0A1S3JP94_LINAN|nr:LOW QUALITY PROTEIN: uncharacterized protein LOC106174703 [Lingula anatina]|eukprot:XP_013411819.1 LOW QUALITY PROTEIN: uncharacterized protein LOC106174703 [Lingula anatina]
MKKVLVRMTKLYAISDLHVDYHDNWDIIGKWHKEKYGSHCLLLAGDVSDNINLLEKTLRLLKEKFFRVFFVPGNHDLWIRKRSSTSDSIDKFHQILDLCKTVGVLTYPEKIADQFWVVPLFSWYTTPEENVEDSLYVRPTQFVENTEKSNQIWMDNHLCKWPKLDLKSRSEYFTNINKERVDRTYDAPVISFSHFLPRKDLIKPDASEEWLCQQERLSLGLSPIIPPAEGGAVGFNFTRYAGCTTLESQIRKLASVLHVHGHQHRNRDRVIDGVRYVSHCLGYTREREQGYMWGLQEWEAGPKQVWPL